MFNKGDILAAKDRSRAAGYHFIVFYEYIGSNNFTGTFITTDGDFEQNIQMKDNYFEEVDENGGTYAVQNNDSFLACAKLIKLEVWGPFTKVGKLSKDGINFLEDSIGGLEPILWEELINSLK